MEEVEKQAESSKSLKKKLYLVGALFVVGLAIFAYLWLQKLSALRVEAQDVVERAEKYDTLKSTIEEEKSRCESFIAQQEGNFGDFEYCQKFIQWTNENADL